METINANAATLCNYEVLQLMRLVRSHLTRSNSQSHLATVTYQAIRYLEETPCVEQNAEIIKQHLSALQPYQLTKAEKLMIINNPPRKELEIQLMIENSEERLTDQQVQELLEIF